MSFFDQIFDFFSVDDESTKRLLDDIRQFIPQDVKSEEDFQKQLYQWLSSKGYPVKREVRFTDDNKADLVVNDIDLELKLADSAKNIQDMIGQVTVYSKHFRKIIAVILDGDLIKDIDKYTELIKAVDPEKIMVLVIKGSIRREEKDKYVLVKK